MDGEKKGKKKKGNSYMVDEVSEIIEKSNIKWKGDSLFIPALQNDKLEAVNDMGRNFSLKQSYSIFESYITYPTTSAFYTHTTNSSRFY